MYVRGNGPTVGPWTGRRLSESRLPRCCGGVVRLLQRRHALLRNFPVIGHGRYLLESLGPELRQYIVTRNDEERPFTRDQRHWVYAVSKRENDTFGFGTDNDIEFTDGYTIIKHRTFSRIAPSGAPHSGEGLTVPSAKILGGGPRGRAKAFRPESFVNVSAMSFGSLSSAAWWL